LNFFSHAIVATWRSAEPEFVLGAMLPDFANMVRARVRAVRAEGVERGVAFHHDTDRVFHDAPTFRALQADARAELRSMGLPRPGALAVGHIGVEMLLDGVLAGDRVGVEGYLAALARGSTGGSGAYIEWTEPEATARFDGLLGVLLTRGIYASAAEPEAVALRVARALSPRPRIALRAEDQEIVRVWAERAMPRVSSAAEALVAEVLTGLPGTMMRPFTTSIR
jgi:hypothetical protein